MPRVACGCLPAVLILFLSISGCLVRAISKSAYLSSFIRCLSLCYTLRHEPPFWPSDDREMSERWPREKQRHFLKKNRFGVPVFRGSGIPFPNTLPIVTVVCPFLRHWMPLHLPPFRRYWIPTLLPIDPYTILFLPILLTICILLFQNLRMSEKSSTFARKIACRKETYYGE